MKKALLILLTLTMLMSIVVVAPVNASAAEGAVAVGKVAADYEPEGKAITSADDFAAMDADGKYYLAKDITLSATYATNFTGTLDGNGKTITTTVAPLFNEFNGTLKNLTVAAENAITATTNLTGVIANKAATTNNVAITNVANKVSVVGSSAAVAGFIGVLNNGSECTTVFTNCENSGSITGGNSSSTTADCSAFVSQVIVDTASDTPYVTFNGCVNNGVVNVSGRVGAFVALSRGGIKLIDCVNNGTLQAINGYVGGLVGRLGDSAGVSFVASFENCVNNADILSYYAQGGGIVGYADMADKLTFKNCVNNGNVDFTNAAANNSNLGGILGAFEANRADEVIFDGCINNGDVGANTTTTYSLNAGGIVGRANQLKVMQTYVNCVNNGEITSTTASSFVGGIVGRIDVLVNSKGYKFDGCINNGDITSGYNAGGILGTETAGKACENSQFIRCGNTGDVTGGTYAGGIAGKVQRAFTYTNPVVTFLYCYNTGAVHSDTNYVGGIVGGRDNFQSGLIQYCFVAGSVTSDKAISATNISNGGTVAREKIYSYEGATGTRYFYGPQSGTVAIEGDKVTWTSSSLKVKGEITSGTTVATGTNGVYKITVNGKDYAVNLAVGDRVEVVDTTLPIITVNGIKADAVEFVPNASGIVTFVLDTYAADEFAPWAFALCANYVGNVYESDNYVLDSVKAVDIAQGSFGTIFAYKTSCATRVSAEDFASGAVAYALNQAAGKTVFYQDLGKDDYPTTDKTHAKVYCVDGEYVNAKITGANVAVGQDLSIKYHATIAADDMTAVADDFAMRFTMNGESVTVDEYFLENDKFVFAFRGIAPQCMTDNIKAELLFNGEVVDVLEEYSVLENAEAILAAYPDNEALVQFVVDMLNYGAAAQLYKDYNVETLANAGIELAASEALPTESIKNKVTADDVTLGDVHFTGANVWFDNVNKIAVKLNAYTENTKVVIKRNGEVVATVEDLTSNVIYTDAIYAVEFEDVYTFELYEGEVLQQTYTYSVASYVYAKMNQTEQDGETLTEMAELARALYRYGASAVAYVNTQK